MKLKIKKRPLFEKKIYKILMEELGQALGSKREGDEDTFNVIRATPGRKKMKSLPESRRKYLNEELSFLPVEILHGEEEFDEEEGEEGILVKNIPMTSLSMSPSQGKGILSDIWRNELSKTDGLPVLFYNTEKKQLIVDDGNHRIFQTWLKGEDSFDAYVYSGTWHDSLRHVYDGEEKFDWDEEYRK